MFLGHFALGFAAKKVSSKPSLGTLFMATQFIDLLWPFLLIFGFETIRIEPGNTAFTPINFVSYPYSHSLMAVLIWGLLFGVIYYMIRKDLKSAVLLGALVLSHWFLDLIAHRPDLPITFSEQTKVGLGLWNYKTATLIIELLVFAAGILIYTSVTKAKNNTGRYALWGLVAFFVIIYFMNAYSDPPPDVKAIGYVGLAQWLFVFWGYWIDKNRVERH
ncbi:MAG TPA: hypothetical protein VGD17_16265 [Chitinophagaceae bacterium]